MSEPTGAWEEIAGNIRLQTFTSTPFPDLPLLQILPPAGTDSGRPCTVVVREPVECIAFFRDPPPVITGVALDIGTTTLSAYLCDLETGVVIASASMVNPQVAYGEDIIVQACAIIDSSFPLCHSEPFPPNLINRSFSDSINRLFLVAPGRIKF